MIMQSRKTGGKSKSLLTSLTTESTSPGIRPTFINIDTLAAEASLYLLLVSRSIQPDIDGSVRVDID